MITRTGQVLGTPHYMSPEQACARGDTGIATDVYSLGAILYALLTGAPPHTGATTAEVLRSVLQDEPEPPRAIRRDVSPDLEKICMKAMHFEPMARYLSAQALADDLNRFLQGEPTSVTGSRLLDRVAREIRRDQHQIYFEKWGKALVLIGLVVFFSHILMFLLNQQEIPAAFAFWLPRAFMLGTIFAAIAYARGGSLLPRSTAERPVYSIWLAYLLTLAVMNLLAVARGDPPEKIFVVASALSGFGFLAMSGHIWGGSALFGLGFLVTAMLANYLPEYSPLMLGGMWLISMCSIAYHYHSKNRELKSQ